VRRRLAGKSSITAIRSIYYIVHVLLGVLVNILRWERRRPKAPVSAAATEEPEASALTAPPSSEPSTEVTGA
jgi:hypothetical protein